MLTSALVLSVLVATSPFDDSKKDAFVVERLPSAVASLVGVCPDGLMVDELEACQKNIKAGSKDFKNKRVYINLGGGLEQYLAFGGSTGSTAKFIWTPIVDLGNGLAMTIEKPQKLGASGNVVVARRPFEGESNPDMMDSDLQRAIKTGQVGVEVIGRFGHGWELSGKSNTVRGVIFELEAARFYHTRTGKVLVAWHKG